MKKTEVESIIESAKGSGFYANLSYTNLSRMDLSGVDFSSANLCKAILIDSILSGASLKGSVLTGVTGNGKEIKTLQTETRCIVYTKHEMAIGHEQHSLKDWYSYTDKEFSRHEDDPEAALKFWKKWRPILVSIGVFDDVKSPPDDGLFVRGLDQAF